MNYNSSNNNLVAGWRTNGSAGSPAGPLFISGAFAEADIVGERSVLTLNGCSACTASRTSQCC